MKQTTAFIQQLYTRNDHCRRALQRVRTFGPNQSGAIAIMFALMLPVIVGFVGIGVEVGSWYSVKRNMQSATDAAAVAAAIERANGGTLAEISAAAQTAAANNGLAIPVTINIPPIRSINFIGSTNHVEAVISQNIETLFAGMFIGQNVTSLTYAVATTIGDQDACFLSLAPTGSRAFNVGSANLNMTGCGIFANSDDPRAVFVQPGSIIADCVATAGGSDGIGTITTVDGRCAGVRTNQQPMDDPFATMYEIPVYGDCPAGGASYNAGGIYKMTGAGSAVSAPFAGTLNMDGSYTLSEGVYCNGLSISSGETVIMNPGTYIMEGGDFLVNGGATVTGDGVTVILTDKNNPANGTGNAQINGNGNVDLSAPIDPDTDGTIQGDFVGALIIQDPLANTSPSKTSIFTGGSTLQLDGLVYTPSNDLTFNGGVDMPVSDCLLLVGQVLDFNGDATINNQCSQYFSDFPISFGNKPGLVE